MEVGGLILKVTPSGERYLVTFSVLVNTTYVVGITYIVKFDGSEGVVLYSRDEKVGTVQMKRLDLRSIRLC